MVNEPSVFELLRFDCIRNQYRQPAKVGSEDPDKTADLTVDRSANFFFFISTGAHVRRYFHVESYLFDNISERCGIAEIRTLDNFDLHRHATDRNPMFGCDGPVNPMGSC